MPIWALYMKKVYDDPTLGYDQQEKFKLLKDLIHVPVRKTPEGEVIEEGDWTILTKSEISINP